MPGRAAPATEATAVPAQPPAPTLPTPQAAQTSEQAEDVTIDSALAKAFRNNPDLYSRRLTQEINEITYQNAWENMFLPKITLGTTTSTAHTVGQLRGSAAQLAGPGAYAAGTPASAVQLSLGEFTIYNFGRDRNTYDLARLNMERSRQSMHEVERQVRFDVIKALFDLRTKQDLLEISSRSVESAEAIYELVKSRIPLGRATETDLASAQVDLLNAQNVYIQDKIGHSQSLWALNITLGDPVNHPYNVKAKVSYVPFKTKLEDVLRVYKEYAPALKDARLGLESARIALQNAQKANLPLPTITFSGITVGYNVGPRGTTPVRTTTAASSSGNFDLSASVNFTVPLTGDGGFLNGRALRSAEIQAEIAEISLRKTGSQTEVSVRSAFIQILEAEKTIQNNEKLLKDASQVFDAALMSLQKKGQLNRLDLKNALEQLRQSEQNLTNSIVQHYNLKLQLAQLIGVDRYPEDSL